MAMTCGTSNFMAYRKLFSVLPDAFDFALVMAGMQIFRPKDLAENVPYDVLVSNSVQNIGMDSLDKTAQFGSAGRLKSVIYHSFGDLAIFDHEVAHTWGAAIGQSRGLLDETYNVNQGHWGKLTDIQGQLGAYYFDPGGAIGHFAYNGDGTWRLIANTEVEPYSPLELYVIGLLPPEQVPPIHILGSPDASDPNRITAASYRTVSIEDLLRTEGGARIPSAAESQKDFNLAFIIAQDVPYNDAAYAFFSLLSQELMSKDPPRKYSSLAPFYSDYQSLVAHPILSATSPLHSTALLSTICGEPAPIPSPPPLTSSFGFRTSSFRAPRGVRDGPRRHRQAHGRTVCKAPSRFNIWYPA
jgi:hypothetical protein